MTINDRVYGNVDINSEAILQLINSKAIQRLKRIAQFGIPDDFYHLKNYSRYEHSVGVMLLLKKLGASEEEQIAGLLHDVSHTAFSHVIDWVIGAGNTEDYQDEQHARYVTNSDIPKILKIHGYYVDRITDYHHFGLLERDLPDLCADRVDYSLRESPASVISACLPALMVVDNKIVFANKETALLFARHYLKRQMNHWGGFEAASRYRLFANALRQALKMGALTNDDFWHDDNFVVTKLLATNNRQIENILDTLRNKSLSNLPKSSTTVHKKFRYVDPLFVKDNKLIRLSDDSKAFAQKLMDARKSNEQGILIPSIN
jgi:HD superfamily phosphohydrolase